MNAAVMSSNTNPASENTSENKWVTPYVPLLAKGDSGLLRNTLLHSESFPSPPGNEEIMNS